MTEEAERRQEDESLEGDQFAKYADELGEKYEYQEPETKDRETPVEINSESATDSLDQRVDENDFETYAEELRGKYNEEEDNSNSSRIQEDSSGTDGTAFQEEHPSTPSSDGGEGTDFSRQQTSADYDGEGEQLDDSNDSIEQVNSVSEEANFETASSGGIQNTENRRDEAVEDQKSQVEALEGTQPNDTSPPPTHLSRSQHETERETRDLDAAQLHSEESPTRSESNKSADKGEMLKTSGQTIGSADEQAPTGERVEGRAKGDSPTELNRIEPERPNGATPLAEPNPKVKGAPWPIESDSTQAQSATRETGGGRERSPIPSNASETKGSSAEPRRTIGAESKAAEPIRDHIGKGPRTRAEIQMPDETNTRTSLGAFAEDYNRCRQKAGSPSLDRNGDQFVVKVNGNEIPLQNTQLSNDKHQTILKSELTPGGKPIFFWSNGEDAGTSSLPFGARLQSELRKVYSPAYPGDPYIFRASPELQDYVRQRLRKVDRHNFNHEKGDICEEIIRNILPKLGQWKEVAYHPKDKTWQLHDSNRKGPDSLQRSLQSGELSYFEFTWSVKSPRKRDTEALINLRKSPTYKSEQIRNAYVGTMVWDVGIRDMKIYIREVKGDDERADHYGNWIETKGGFTIIHGFGTM